MRITTSSLLAVTVATAFPVGLDAEDRGARVRKDLQDVLSGGKWIYNDLPKGFEEAKKTGKPLLVVIRCIPCEACRGFEEQVASLDARIEKLLDRFVRVRIPQANGLDLSLFQFDYDLSFYAFFLNADRTVYGRFGSRSTQEDKKGDVSIDAFREDLPRDERAAAGLPGEVLALRVKHAGEYGEHATAKNAGVRKGDVLVAVDGKKDPLRETDLIAQGVKGKLPGDKVELTLLRGGARELVSFQLK